ncbi:MAG: UvrB/UvrC motif-containing protein, partial [Candidatus Latescibacteria bacterium]|nr:UvrB/UvrC motif-containing protein [Candidatus Latescibacterota bacterium]
VVMMNTRAKGLLSLRRKAVREALVRIQAGIRAIERFFEEYHREDLIEESEEILFLKRWAEEIEQNRPRSPVKRLQKALDDAVEHEEYEKAMRFRDRIREMEAGTNQAREIVEKQERI